MKSTILAAQSVDQLVDRFIEISLAQDDAIILEETERFNALHRELVRIRAELKSRPGDARRTLVRLYGHANFQVWINAARETLAVAPEEARKELGAIKASQHQPQSMDAGMALWTLDEGIYRPS